MWRRTALLGSGAVTAAAIAFPSDQEPILDDDPEMTVFAPPSRQSMLDQLKSTKLDILIIGGGATGTGCALDAASRGGLAVACIDAGDWSSGTSSKSTKLVHGGVRYLEKAVRELDLEQWKLVKEALHERRTVLGMAPHLTDALPIMLPLYGPWWKVPYYWAGTKVYDLIASRHGVMQSSFLMGKERAIREFPLLKRQGLLGALVYYDGQQDDARMNVALAVTAMRFGAIMCNYVRVVDLVKDEQGRLIGATLQNTLQKEKPFTVQASTIINATGPFCDAIRLMDDPTTPKLVSASSGVHIVLPEYYSPRTMGLLDPQTKDGRVIFFLPWQHNSLAGTTEAPVPGSVSVDNEPEARFADIDYILSELNEYLDEHVRLRRCDVISAWAGLRPLVKDPNKTDTASFVRNHLIDVSKSGLITITGGKWTTFRQMAQECVDTAILNGKLKPKHTKSITETIRLVGSHQYSDKLYIKLIQQFGFDTHVAKHLARSYGDRALGVALIDAETTSNSDRGKEIVWPLSGQSRLSPYYPYIEAEVKWAVRHEQAQTPDDILCRRTRLAFHNCRAALDALPRVCDIMQQELHWSDREKEEMMKMAKSRLEKLGLPILTTSRTESTLEQVQKLMAVAREYGPNGYIPRHVAEAVIGKKLPNHGEGMVSLVDIMECLHQ